MKDRFFELLGRLTGNPRTHWIVPTYYKVRSASYIYASLFLGLFLWEQDPPVWVWVLLGLQLYVYPHVVYLRALSSPDPQQAELGNLLIDSSLWGFWCALLGFPVWISFTLFITSSMNTAFSRGWRGLRDALLLFTGFAALAMVMAGPTLAPTESPVVIALCLAGMSVYLLNIGNIAFLRTEQLRRTREQLKQSEATLRIQASQDSLTGLFNRRILDEWLQRELAQSAREGVPLSLMVLDVDHFKRINDTFGHGVGDETLRQLAALIGRSVRQVDVVCRIGGEEFAILQPRMPTEAASERAEVLRQACAGLQIPTVSAQPLRITVSIGIASFPMDGLTGSELIGAADRAMYQAKNDGRNLVRTHKQVHHARGSRTLEDVRAISAPARS